MPIQQALLVKDLGFVPPGQQEWTSPGTQSWTVPAGITDICILCIGGGAGGAGGGATGYRCCGGAGGGGAWKNNVSVTPGEVLTIITGSGGSGNSGGSNSEQPGGNGGDSKVERSGTALCHASGATWNGHSSCNGGNVVVGDGGGLGGGDASLTGSAWGNGNQMVDLDGTGNYSGGCGGYGTGGGGGGVGNKGGGAWQSSTTSFSHNGRGTYDILSNNNVGYPDGGTGRSGGTNGSGGSGGYGNIVGGAGSGGAGGYYGGGGGGGQYGGGGGQGGKGAVRIMWGSGRAYPNTSTQDL